MCSLGLTDNFYKDQTCPMKGCPNSNQPKIIYLDKFDHDVIDEVEWEFKFNSFGAGCRFIIKADPRLNARLNIKILTVGEQVVHLMKQPNTWDNEYNEIDGPWGILENNHFPKYVKDNHEEQVPSDWHIVI